MKQIENAALRARLGLRDRIQPRRLFQGRQIITLPHGTCVRTDCGTRRAESIGASDHLLTRTGGSAKVMAVRSRKAMVQTVRFVNPMADGGDQILPWDQPVLLRDWRAQALFGQPQAVVPAYELVDGEHICDLGMQMTELVVLEFARPHVIFAGGLELAAAAMQSTDDLRPAA